jgi:hypothetical protein
MNCKIYNVSSCENKFLEKIYTQSIKELSDFFGIKIEKPNLFFVKDRKTINLLRNKKTEDWVVGWAYDNNIFVIDKNNYEKESSHKYFKERYVALIKHEIAHVFYREYIDVFNESILPNWLSEGVAIYLSGQNKFKESPKIFKNFLKFYNNNSNQKDVYYESGFVVEHLVETYGKQKLLKLLKSLKKIKTEKQFMEMFKKIYKFELNYDVFNKNRL